MTVLTDRIQTGRRGRQPVPHLFRIGQIVRMKSRLGVSFNTADFYRIIATLPPRDNALQYRVRSDEERHERVVTQDILQAADVPATGSGATLIERTFGHGQRTKTQQPRNTKTQAGKGSAQA